MRGFHLSFDVLVLSLCVFHLRFDGRDLLFYEGIELFVRFLNVLLER